MPAARHGSTAPSSRSTATPPNPQSPTVAFTPEAPRSAGDPPTSRHPPGGSPTSLPRRYPAAEGRATATAGVAGVVAHHKSNKQPEPGTTTK